MTTTNFTETQLRLYLKCVKAIGDNIPEFNMSGVTKHILNVFEATIEETGSLEGFSVRYFVESTKWMLEDRKKHPIINLTC